MDVIRTRSQKRNLRHRPEMEGQCRRLRGSFPGGKANVQIGQGESFQFCKDHISPLQAVFNDGFYQPNRLIMFLMGNVTRRWVTSAEAALQDARAFIADLPAGQPCIFMTSAPTYGEKSVRLHQSA